MDEILEIFMEEPEKEFHVREIARRLKKSPTTVSKYLKDFEKGGILLSKKRFSHLIYRANTESKLFITKKLSRNIESILKSGLVEFLNEELNHPEALGIFGSFAKGENVKKSDIDLFIITPVKKEINLIKFEKKLGHKIDLFTFSRKDIDKIKTENKELLNSILNGVILDGHWNLFR